MNDLPILILLAGGKSARMGSPKGLLDYNGIPWILEQITRYNHIKNPRVYIGLGYDLQKYFDVIPWFKKAIDDPYNYNGVEVRVIINGMPEFGAFSTLQKVLKKVEKHTEVIVQPIDVPLPSEQSLTAIINENNTIVIPKCNGKNGHPVKLKPKFWSVLLSIDLFVKDARLDTQIRKINTSSVTYIKVLDNSVYQNINTKEKWNNYLNIIKHSNNFKP